MLDLALMVVFIIKNRREKKDKQAYTRTDLMCGIKSVLVLYSGLFTTFGDIQP